MQTLLIKWFAVLASYSSSFLSPGSKMSKTYEGYLLIADITGYTRYLSESELEHAQETLTALLELLVENTRPWLSAISGDAVISYGLRETSSRDKRSSRRSRTSTSRSEKPLSGWCLISTCRCNAAKSQP
jgi:hypothetical protein